MADREMTNEEAIKIIEDVRAVVLCNGKYDNAMRMAIEALKAEPIKHGQWVSFGRMLPHGVSWMHCSVCGRMEPELPNAKSAYCPHCGAAMDLGEVEE